MHLKLFCLVAGHFPLWGGGFVWLAPFGARFGAASVWGRLHLTKYFFNHISNGVVCRHQPEH
jgi:hypothetical protein